MINKHQQQGAETVEFALIVLLVFALIFAVVEFGRALFVWNALTEATRRGARMAVVCPLNSTIPKQVALFNAINGSGNSTVIKGLTPSMVQVKYYLNDGVTETTDQTKITFINVSIIGYTHRLIIPIWGVSLIAPKFTTTLYSESLGTIPTYPPAISTTTNCNF